MTLAVARGIGICRLLHLGLLVALVASLGAWSPAAAADDWPGRYGSLGSRLQGVVDRTLVSGVGIPGISAAIQTPDGTWTGVAGDASVSPARPVAADTPFAVASVTKTFVAAVVMQLVEEGRLSLDDRLSRWVSGIPNGSRITVRQMLQHTSGIRDIFDSPRYVRLVEGRQGHVWTFSEIKALIGAPLFAPGAGWRYSNSNYILLGRIVERVTGMGIARAIRTRILGPLGLRDTWFQGAESQDQQVAMGYHRVNGRWKAYGDGTGLRPYTSMATFVWAAGAMVSTPADLARWARALYGGTVRTAKGGRILSAASVRLMTTFNDRKYGLGTRKTTLGDRVAWGHGGSLDGFETSMWYLPRIDASVVVTWNRYLHESDDLARKLAERLVDTIDPDTQPPVVAAPTVAIRSGLATQQGRLPVRVAWPRAVDVGTVTRYELERRTGAGAWQRVTLASPRATSVAMWLTTDRTVRFRLRAADDEGNISDWVPTEPLRASFVDEDAVTSVTGSGWQRIRADGALGGWVLRGRHTSGRLRLDVAGARSIAVVVMRGGARTPVGVRWDTDAGVARATAGSRRPRWVLIARRWAAGDAHSVRLAVRAAGTPRVDIDGFLILSSVPG